MTTRSAYRPEIDGLRTLAVLSVVVYHALPRRLPGGFVGVDVFFVISGYLISRIILADLARDRFSILDFYVRRARRIFPALLLVLACTLAAGWVLLTVDEWKALGRHLAAGVGFVSNLVFWSEAGYFDAAAESKATLHLWSLAVEEQFYLAWPFVLALAVRRRMRLAAVICLLGAASFVVSVHGALVDPTAAYYSPLSRFWELMAGALMTQGEERRDAWSQAARSWMAAAGLALLAVSMTVISPARPFPGYWALLPVGGACLVLAGGSAAWANRHLLAWRPMVFIGLISYPVYLWHWPIFTFVRLFTPQTHFSTFTAALAIAASLLAGWATHALLEKPLRRWRPERRAATRLTTGMVAMLVLGLAVAWSVIPARNSDSSVQALLDASRDWDGAAYFDTVRTPVAYQRMGAPGAGAETVYIGDSHMQHYRARLDEVYRTQPHDTLAALTVVTDGGCVPIPSVYEDHGIHRHCGPTRAFGYQYALRPEVSKVVIAACWNCYFASDRRAAGASDDAYRYYTLVGDRREYFSDGDGAEHAYRELGELLHSLVTEHHKTVYLVLDNASGASYAPQSYFSRSATGRLQGRERPGKIAPDPLQVAVRERLIAIATAAGARLLDPWPINCDADGCVAFDDEGRPLYMDSSHLRPQVVRARAGFLDQTAMRTTADAPPRMPDDRPIAAAVPIAGSRP